MKKSSLLLRMALLIVVIGPLSALVYQNSHYFLQPVALSFNIPNVLPAAYTAPAVSNLVYWLASLFTGLAIAACYHMAKRFRLKKQIKQLQASLAAADKQRQQLQDELDQIRAQSQPQPAFASAVAEPVESSSFEAGGDQSELTAKPL